MAKLSYKATKNNQYPKISSITPELQELINTYNLDFDSSANIVLLTRKNANIIEELIRPNYIQFARMIFDYYRLNEISIKHDKDALLAVIRMIDYENSTQGYQKFPAAFSNMVNSIWDNREEFFRRLEMGDKTLPDQIVEWAGTNVKSLSSKVCQHLHEFLVNNDKYYKNDRYIRHSILFYLDYYYQTKVHTEKSSRSLSKKAYSYIFDLLEKLKEHPNVAHEDLKRSEIDHIIWFSYKSFEASL